MTPYLLKRNSRSRSLRLRLEPDGTVVVTAPPLVPKILVDSFVRKHEPWIEKQKRRHSFKKLSNPVLDWDEQVMMFKGDLLQIVFGKENERVIITGGKVVVSPVTGEIHHLKPTLLKWLKREAELYFEENVNLWAEKMTIQFRSIAYKQQKSRWGSCSSKGNLNFNWRLIHFKPAVIDYVIIHELAHIAHLNHSPDFWALVRKFDPRYKEKVRFLQNQVLDLV